MKSLLYHHNPFTVFSNCNSVFVPRSIVSLNLSSISSLPIRPQNRILKSLTTRPQLNSQSSDRKPDDDIDSPVEELRVPDQWSEPSKALEESEWLRVTLRQWLDDEYCPEVSNEEISKVAAYSYRTSLVAKQLDLGEILLKMATELETISYQDSFHGAFSSANAAINLIAQRIDQQS